MAPMARRLALVVLVALSAVHAASHGPKDRANKPVAERRAAVPEGPPSPSYGFGDWLHYCVGGLEVLLVFACLTSADGTLAGSLLGALFSRRSKYTRCLVALGLVFALEWAAHLLTPLAHVSAGVMILVSVLFTINPVEEAGRPLALSMGTVPLACILWLCAVGVISQAGGRAFNPKVEWATCQGPCVQTPVCNISSLRGFPGRWDGCGVVL